MISAVPNGGFYRRPLPETCVDFSSAEGKKLFRESLAEGYLEGYFKLAANFHTQADPAFCGLGTLSMVLNSLEIDPNRIWKGPWRWFSEDMLDCCVPLEQARTNGITLDQFVCLAQCNGADAVAHRNSPLEEFRSAIERIASGAFGPGEEREMLVVSYNRKTMGQTGTGHFSPIAAYHKSSDRVLIMDVARFKYPPHWASVELLWKSMQDLDSETGLPRGYVIMKRKKTVALSTLFRILGGPTEWRNIVTQFLAHLIELATSNKELVSPEATATPGPFIRVCVKALTMSKSMNNVADYYGKDPYALPEEHQAAIEKLRLELRQTPLAEILKPMLAPDAPPNFLDLLILMILGLLGAVCETTTGVLCGLCPALPRTVCQAAAKIVTDSTATLSLELLQEVQIFKSSIHSLLDPSCCTKDEPDSCSNKCSHSCCSNTAGSCHH